MISRAGNIKLGSRCSSWGNTSGFRASTQSAVVMLACAAGVGYEPYKVAYDPSKTLTMVIYQLVSGDADPSGCLKPVAGFSCELVPWTHPGTMIFTSKKCTTTHHSVCQCYLTLSVNTTGLVSRQFIFEADVPNLQDILGIAIFCSKWLAHFTNAVLHYF